MDQLGRRSQDDMIQLWDRAGALADVDFFDFITEAFPDIVIPYHQLAAEFAATAFEEDFPDMVTTAAAAVADPPPVEQLRRSAQWAMGADGRKALDRMSGTIQRHIYDGDRDTTAINAEARGMRWVRIARPNACEFCRLLASRAAAGVDLYRNPDAVVTNADGELELRVVGRSTNLSVADRRAIASGQMTREEALLRRDQMQLTYQIGRRRGTPRGRRPRGTQAIGDKYHDDCKCTAKAIPAGRDTMEYLYEQEPEAAFAAEQFLNEYNKAVDNAGSTNTRQVMAEWRRQISASQITPIQTAVQPENFLDRLPKISRPSLQEAVTRSNPGFDPIVLNRRGDNCTHCVTAFDLRRRGVNVQATEARTGANGLGIGQTFSEVMGNYTDANGENRTPTELMVTGMRGRSVRGERSDLDEIVRSWGDGGRGFVAICWKNGNGHILAVENVGGEVRYIDPQSAKLDAARSLNKTARRKGTPIVYARVDDLTPAESIFDPANPLVEIVEP